MQQSGPGDIPQPLHCNWSSGTGRAAKAPQWPRVISVYRAVSHPSEWTAIAGSCTGTRGEHTLSICATPWRRAPFCAMKGGRVGLNGGTGPVRTGGDHGRRRGKKSFTFLLGGGVTNSSVQLNRRGQRWLWTDNAALIWTIRFQVAPVPEAMWPRFLCSTHN